tara:strand:- start:544059 stop:544313 length:255 start_codon:yes stop_codon:yes gene_type:complete
MEKIASIKEEVKKHIVEAALIDADKLDDNTLIFDAGLLDSMGLLFLIEFLKETYNVEVSDDELNPKNFESINNIVSFVSAKLEN